MVVGIQDVRQGNVPTHIKNEYYKGQDLAGSTVGLVGFGRVGTAIVQRLQPFKVKTFLYCGPNPKPALTNKFIKLSKDMYWNRHTF